jgi:hypothetical protein
MSYDPKLKEAMAEISAVLKKHDIAGAVTLVSKTHSEYKYHFPTWSAAQITDEGIRFRTKSSDYADKQAADQALLDSLHVVLQIHDLNSQNIKVTDQLIKKIGEHVDFDHVPYFDHTPHRLN